MQPSSSIPTRLPDKTAWQTRLPFFYGWVVVASIFAVLTIDYGVYYSFSVFFVALLEEFGWSRAATAGVFSVHLVMLGFAGAVSGSLIDRFGPSRVVSFGAALLAVALVACSQLTELWQFYLSFGVFGGMGLALSGWVPTVTVISAWFSSKRGLAIGVASAGIGLGTVAFVPLCQHLISTSGWRSAYLVLAALSFFVSVPHTFIFLVGRPDRLGLKPDGPPAKAESAAPKGPVRRIVPVDQKWASFPWTILTAMRTSRFWFMSTAISATTLTNQMLWAHEAAYLVDNGLDKMLAASVVGLAGLLSMPAKILWGEASDRFGREKTFTMGIATMLMAIGLLVLVGSYPVLPLIGIFALAFAFGYAVNAPLTPASAGDIFAGRNFGGIFGVMNLGGSVGGAFGAWLAGYIFDVTGSYIIAFATAATTASLAVVSLWFAAPRKVRRVEKVI